MDLIIMKTKLDHLGQIFFKWLQKIGQYFLDFLFSLCTEDIMP